MPRIVKGRDAGGSKGSRGTAGPGERGRAVDDDGGSDRPRTGIGRTWRAAQRPRPSRRRAHGLARLRQQRRPARYRRRLHAGPSGTTPTNESNSPVQAPRLREDPIPPRRTRPSHRRARRRRLRASPPGGAPRTRRALRRRSDDPPRRRRRARRRTLTSSSEARARHRSRRRHRVAQCMRASRPCCPPNPETAHRALGGMGEWNGVGGSRTGEVLRSFVCEGAIGAGGGRRFGVPGSCAVVPGGARSYPGARGRTRERAVVPGSARSYLKDPLRYDRAALRTTARAGGTTTRLYVRPRGTDDAQRRSGIHSPAPRAPQADGARRADQRRGTAGPMERSRTHADADARTRKQRATSTRDLRDSFAQGRARACCKEAAYRYRQRRRTRNINDSSCAFRPKPDPCSRIGHPSAGTDPRRQTVRRRPAPSKGTTTNDPTSGTTRARDPSPLPRQDRQRHP